MPRSTTSTPCERTPSAKAADNSTPGGTHVSSDEHTRRTGKAGERRTDAAAHRRIELVGREPPDVVGLEDRVEVAHGKDKQPIRMRRRATNAGCGTDLAPGAARRGRPGRSTASC